MSEINRPLQVVSDDDYAHIADGLVEYFDLDNELEDEEVSEFDVEEATIVANYDKYINMAQVDQDLADGGDTTYKPAQVIRVLSKSVRTLPDGQVVVDYELEIQEVVGASSYQVRVAEQ